MIPAEIIVPPVTYCPGCGDDCGPGYAVSYCPRHMPDAHGADDEQAARALGTAPGQVEAGGESNAAWCAFFHRREPE